MDLPFLESISRYLVFCSSCGKPHTHTLSHVRRPLFAVASSHCKLLVLVSIRANVSFCRPWTSIGGASVNKLGRYRQGRGIKGNYLCLAPGEADGRLTCAFGLQEGHAGLISLGLFRVRLLSRSDNLFLVVTPLTSLWVRIL